MPRLHITQDLSWETDTNHPWMVSIANGPEDDGQAIEVIGTVSLHFRFDPVERSILGGENGSVRASRATQETMAIQNSVRSKFIESAGKLPRQD